MRRLLPAQAAGPFLILDANQHVGDAWRNRWDSLRLFTPSRYMLPGLRLAGCGNHFPSKDQLADYLAEYAGKFDLPVKNGIRVDRLRKIDGRFISMRANAASNAKT